MLGLNTPSQHQSPVGSSSPIVQSAGNRAPSPEWERLKLPQPHAAPAPLSEPHFMPQPPAGAAPTSTAAPAAVAPTTTAAPAATAAPAKSLPELFFGKIPLNPHMASKIDEDKIAEAFHNSTRKTLNYIPPSVQNGEVIVRPSIDMIRTGSHRWKTTAVGYFLGKKPYFHHLNEFVRSIWPVPFDGYMSESNKIEKPKVAVYVQKRPVHPPPMVSKPMVKDAVRTVWHTVPEEDGTVDMEIGTDPLAKCDMMNAAFWNVRGLNRRDHQVAVKELVNEFRLNFLGLLETRVSAVNVMRVQTFLPQWSWFTDYDMPGNRIWIAWDDELLDVDVLNLDVQFIHCRINIRCAHLSVLATVVYGANDSVSRRGLWQSLVTLADSISDEPWIVGGDFNTVVDMSEVCGASADIHLAMNEFRDCILGTGLIHLPVQGELFSWHNCSEGDRSLWKRLDRLLVNDAWLRLWPNLHYQCLNARTSDHSPLVLRGDTDKHTVSHASTTSQDPMVKRGGSMLSDILPKGRYETGIQAATARGDRRREFIDLRYLRPWARHVLTQEESQALVQSVTREEIKDAFFDIAEDKAPGPDGYSSGFSKAAWPVIGEEMIKAILEFFTTGRLLKQVNTTILALIPKNAFVLGRSIGDNILLAQELFAGYNRQGLPMRCALKVDLRRHTTRSNGISLVPCYKLFGFLGTFIGWVEECVTTPMFSVCINGNLTFLQGSRGMRDSPSIGGARSLDYSNFALQMTSSSSVKLMWIRTGCPEQLLAALHFQEGHLPLRYLGLPLLASRLSISDCKPLLLKIDSRIKGWESIQLSFAGRLQLIKSVLMSLKVYWAMAFILPKGVIREVEKKMRTFLWKGNSAVGYPKVAWSVVCKPIEEDGQGIRDILALNKAPMSRHLWNVIQNNQSSIWVKWIAHTRLRHKSVWTVDVKGGSWVGGRSYD
ncbi:hypothetical protein Sango_3088000 [Sesamum angolense]|uniref:Endonuclease/exonuclease/phosphatase domain-containing protein n=1 Tax=Sesamum angolense TaxID=2727404 RepID=A0AAE1T9Q6_9LAMI|nr:hypothetical protein Sango_3088000 [Sesamum angolense]